MTFTVQVEGIAFHAPWAAGWDVARAAWRGESPWPEGQAPRPTNSVLAPTERRRAPDTVAIALYLAEAACAAANRAPTELASVFASTYGDLAISDYMCETLVATPRMISPTRFHNSVHNAAAGYWTIGTGSMKAATALCAEAATFAEALLEAVVQVQADGEPVLLVCYDIEARGPLASMCPSRAMAGHALVLAPVDAARALPRLTLLPDGTAKAPSGAAPVGPGADHPLAASFPLFAALATGGSHELCLATDAGGSLRVMVQA